MADNVFYDSAGERTELAYDEVGGVKFARNLLVFGPDGGPLTQVDVGSPLPVTTGIRTWDPLGYEKVPVSTGAATGITPPDGALIAAIQPAVDIRWRDDGTDPTATTGMRAGAYSELTYDGNFLALRLIAVSAGGEIDISYYG